MNPREAPQAPPFEARGLDDVMTPGQVAGYLKVAVNTLRHWRRTGQGPAWYKQGRLVRYTGKAVKEYHESVIQGGSSK